MRQSDILSLHVPSLPETYHLLNARTIAECKDGVYIVNTSRGVNADEKAIYDALTSGKIRGYGSDVFEFEPVTKDYALFRCPNYICTPHIAAESYENYDNTGMATAKAVLAVLTGEGEPWHQACLAGIFALGMI